MKSHFVHFYKILNLQPLNNQLISGSYLQQPQTVGMGLPRPVATSGLVNSTASGLNNSTNSQMASVSNGHLDHPSGQLGSSSRIRQQHVGLLPSSSSNLGSRASNNSGLAIPRATSRLGLATRGIQWTGRQDNNNNNNNNTNNNNK